MADETSMAGLLEHGDPRRMFHDPALDFGPRDVMPRLPPVAPRAELRNPGPRPPDPMQPLYENVSPTMGAHSMASLLTEMGMDATHGNTTGFADKLPMAMGMLAGVKAKTANLPALSKAHEMASKGATRDAIWNDTGWFQGADKKWRFEIDDSGAALGRSQNGRLSNVLEHDPLYEAYPDLGKTPTKGLGAFLGLLVGGGYKEPQPKWFGLSQDRGEMVYSKAYDGPDRIKKLVHEGQHGVQGIEDFARGANPEVGVAGLTEQETAVLQARRRQLAEAERTRLLSLAKQWNPDNFRNLTLAERQRYAETHAKYLRDAANADAPSRRYFQDEPSFLRDLAYDVSAGEVEARNVEKRLNMTPDQRKASPPWATEDIPTSQQIVRFKP